MHVTHGVAASDLMRRVSFGAAVLAGTWLLSTVSVDAQVSGTSDSSVTQRQRAQTVAAAPSEYQTLYVNPEVGSDSAEGRETEPLRTVTQALEIAAPNTVIVLAAGRYNRASGEVFPLQLKSGVTIQGAPGSQERSAIIEGGATFESPTRSQQNAAIVAADRAGIAQVAISNPEGYGVWVEAASPTILETAFVGNRQTGIYVADGSPRIQNNYFSGNQVAGLIVSGLSSASIASNTFDSTGDAIRVAEGATPEIVGNRIINNNAGLVLIGSAEPVVRNNQIVGNRRNEIVQVSADNRAGRAAAEPVVRSPREQAPSTARKVPIPADAVPGEMTGDLPILASSLPYTPPPTQTLAAAQPISRPIVASPAQPRVRPAPDLPETIELEPAPAVESVPVREESVSREELNQTRSQLEDDLAVLPDAGDIAESDTSSEAIPDGSPGAALSALRSGIALSPRAVSGENPDSPILRRRRERLERERNRDEIDRREPVRRSAPPINNDRLAVPSSRIPLGSESSSTIFSPPTGVVGGPPAPPSRAQALGLYYRVFVEASNPFEQDEVRSVVPDAFRTRFEGRTVMQVGAFPTEDEAEDRQRILEDNGFNARIEYIR